MATREQIEQLKSSWVADPCWDIEDTECFEEHRDELAAFATEQKQRWEQGRNRRESRRIAIEEPGRCWVRAGSEWLNMARCAAVDNRSDYGYGTLVLYGDLGDAGDKNWVIKAEDAAPVLAYLAAHEA